MTSPPDLPAQIEVREPGWYWTRWNGDPDRWIVQLRAHGRWWANLPAIVDDSSVVEIGPRIPDPVTLQQHERDDARIKQLDNENQRFMREVALLRQQHERLEAALREPTEDLQDALAEAFDAAFLPAWRDAIKKHGTNNVQPAWASWGRKYLTAIADALYAAAPETPETR